jgi:hypothetical protein
MSQIEVSDISLVYMHLTSSPGDSSRPLRIMISMGLLRVALAMWNSACRRFRYLLHALQQCFSKRRCAQNNNTLDLYGWEKTDDAWVPHVGRHNRNSRELIFSKCEAASGVSVHQ